MFVPVEGMVYRHGSIVIPAVCVLKRAIEIVCGTRSSVDADDPHTLTVWH
jgi:hypothetical protein